jgi:hypothetical protein
MNSVAMKCVPMIQRRRRLGLPDESVHPVSVIGEFRRQDLEGDFTAKRRILREIHLAHPAFADWRQDSVLLDDGVRCKRLHMRRPEDRSWVDPADAAASRSASECPGLSPEHEAAHQDIVNALAATGRVRCCGAARRDGIDHRPTSCIGLVAGYGATARPGGLEGPGREVCVGV